MAKRRSEITVIADRAAAAGEMYPAQEVVRMSGSSTSIHGAYLEKQIIDGNTRRIVKRSDQYPPMKTQSLLASIVLSFLGCSGASAAIFQYDLKGTAGDGLLFGNEPSVAFGGTGGEIGTGITFDDATSLLSVNVGWGSSQGFTDLSSSSNNSHIHGPTTSNNGSGFTQTAGVLFNLTRSSNAITGGIFTSAPILLTAPQILDLNNGKYYINVHTVNNGGGELRGFIVPAPAPEPSRAMFALLGLSALAFRRKR
jgi:MYXO-CTERM domain-containing protein